ncbi:hypothetical protein GRF29_1g1411748 [Pseudopithomyces chartarum]|uniref:Uncharacterized protein n=1 Tax=Pseudopithomyces chartarum TaxID=1892770 RepID=A0AAN6M6Y9_9PLEO|nr:hypothetical protein GRF29_1g1411748 [Pseudopithomyces chartarum]
MALRLLLPTLPPELRDLIYTQTIPTSNPATTAGLPFTRKTYDSSHTRVEISPFHNGNPGLLALQHYRYLEGNEYAKWIFANAVTLQITVHFKGHLNTFVQEHWDKKIGAHLKNLAKRNPWLRKVANYEVKIMWMPKESGHGKKMRRIGAVAGRMVEVLTQQMDENVKVKKGDVKAGLFVGGWTVLDYRASGQAMGLGEFVWGLNKGSPKMQVREAGVAVRAEEGEENEVDTYMPSRFRAVPSASSKDEDVRKYQEKPVCRHEVRKDLDELTTFQMDNEGSGASIQLAIMAIAEEITGFGQANMHAKIQP